MQLKSHAHLYDTPEAEMEEPTMNLRSAALS